MIVLGDSISQRGLAADEGLVPANGNYRAIMRPNGNLEVYGGGKVIWDTGTDGETTGGRVEMQNDGNLVVYNKNGKAEWSFDLYEDEIDWPFILTLRNDGNLVVTDRQGDGVIWPSKNGKVSQPAPDIPRPSMFSYTADSIEEAYQVGSRANLLML